MAAGMRLLYLRALYLRPEGSRVRWWLSGCVTSCGIVVAMCAMALLFSSVRLGVGRPIILAAVLVMRVSLVRLVTDNILKKHVKQYSRMD